MFCTFNYSLLQIKWNESKLLRFMRISHKNALTYTMANILHTIVHSFYCLFVYLMIMGFETPEDG